MKIPRLPLGSVTIFTTVIILASFFFLSTSAQSVIIRNQLQAAELSLSWFGMKESLLSAALEGGPADAGASRIEAFSLLLKTVLEREEYESLRRMNSSLNLTMASLQIQWSVIQSQLLSMLADGAPERTDGLTAFLASPQIGFFEEYLGQLRSIIDNYSALQRSHFGIQYLFIAIILLLILLLLLGNAFSSRRSSIIEGNVRSLTQSLIQVQENERKKIAYDLHDEVIQEIASLKMEVESITGTSERWPALDERFQKLIQRTRGISLNLRPHDLDHLGLVGGLKALCGEFSSRFGIRVRFSATGMEAIAYDFTIAINLYRIVQESLANIRKHSGADEVTVTLLGSSPGIILRIRDNGKGFSPANLLNDAGKSVFRLGLTGIQERVRLLSGTFRIISGEANGTEIRITIPAMETMENTLL